MEYPKEEVNNYSAEEKLNDSANFVNQYIVSEPPSTDYSFKIGGIIISEESEESKIGDVSESIH